MNLAYPYVAVTGSGLEGEVLTVLAGTRKQLTGRQVARLARRGSDRGLRLALNRLAEQGIVETVDAPPAVLYSLNLDHVAAPMAIGLAGLRERLLGHLRESARSWPIQPKHLSVFGSAARADGDEHSDIDLFVVRPATVDVEDAAWREQLDALAENVRRWSGNHAGISEVGEADLEQLARNRPPIIAELERDAVVLVGKDVETLLRAAKRGARRIGRPAGAKTRTQTCDADDARKRLSDARKFLELAEVAYDESEPASLGASAANAALAGIAAADAACCKSAGERSRGDDHRDAISLVAQVAPGGSDASKALGRLLAIKNDAEYGLSVVSRAKRELALRQARKLVEFADAVMRR